MNESTALSVLASGADTYDKAMACDALGRVGTAKAVPALSGLLADEELCDYARDGLERIPDPAAGTALLESLSNLEGSLLVGVIITLGDRREASAVPALAKAAGDKDATVSGAALTSLAHIATTDAADAILEVHSAAGADTTKSAAAHAALAAAGRMENAGQSELAAKLRAAAASAGLPASPKITAAN